MTNFESWMNWEHLQNSIDPLNQSWKFNKTNILSLHTKNHPTQSKVRGIGISQSLGSNQIRLNQGYEN